ncbi:hypothetical protein PQD71_gp172 [Kosakonia phage Kc263]|uniref:Thoeris anti-defense 2-like domain-containing protein n=1 Tax=Kosakonia phage Kc263 TaxID=2863194 RepID=A0AAE7WFW1_9CAUD|nr:hypothetical protein PQD71_gp172 [Kosakonia phage Kc263]QYN80065.1 hypothetical protein [Kosakonia phage Kc263]
METTEVRTLSFSEVLNGLKAGRKYQRRGWAGKGLYVQLHGSLPAVSLEGETKYIDKFFVIVNGERVNTWVPSVSDLLAEDWIEVL